MDVYFDRFGARGNLDDKRLWLTADVGSPSTVTEQIFWAFTTGSELLSSAGNEHDL